MKKRSGREGPGGKATETMMRAQLRSLGLGHLADFVTETVTDAAATAVPPFEHERDRAETESIVLHVLRIVARFNRFLTSRFATAEALAISDDHDALPSFELMELSAVTHQLVVSPHTLAAVEARIAMLAEPHAEQAMRRLLDIALELMQPVERAAYEVAKASPRMVGYLGTPSAPADWREWVVLHLQAQAAVEAAEFFIAVVLDLWQSDPQTRREFPSEQHLAALLITVSIGGAGFALAIEDAETHRPIADGLRGVARVALDNLIRDFAAHPAWSEEITRHLHLVPSSSLYHRAAAALVEAARNLHLEPERPAGRSRWSDRRRRR